MLDRLGDYLQPLPPRIEVPRHGAGDCLGCGQPVEGGVGTYLAHTGPDQPAGWHRNECLWRWRARQLLRLAIHPTYRKNPNP